MIWLHRVLCETAQALAKHVAASFLVRCHCILRVYSSCRDSSTAGCLGGHCSDVVATCCASAVAYADLPAP